MQNLSTILKSVSKPGRYTGGEFGQIIKEKKKVNLRIAFCFPDTYEIGMSNLGVRILYGALNQIEDVWCERVYAPWPDMEEKMKEYKNLRGLSDEAKEALAEPCSYNEIRAWFLNAYPAIAKFHEDRAKLLAA